MPGTGAMNIGMLGRTPLVARRGGGFYVAYPTPSGVRVWRVGAGEARVVAGIDNSPAVAIAAAGDGGWRNRTRTGDTTIFRRWRDARWIWRFAAGLRRTAPSPGARDTRRLRADFFLFWPRAASSGQTRSKPCHP
jgi:hypothetical protein